MNRLRFALVVVLSLAATPSLAAAQSAAPPGNSAVDQYRESAPPAARGSRDLSEKQRRRLADRGGDGAALAAALDGSGGVPAESTPRGTEAAPDGAADGTSRVDGDGAPSGSSRRSGRGASDGDQGDPAEAGRAVGQPAATDGSSTTEAAASATVGPFPVWTMMVAALAVVGVGLVVRRRTSA